MEEQRLFWVTQSDCFIIFDFKFATTRERILILKARAGYHGLYNDLSLCCQKEAFVSTVYQLLHPRPSPSKKDHPEPHFSEDWFLVCHVRFHVSLQ